MAYIEKFLPVELHKINILHVQLDIIIMILAKPTVQPQKDAQCLEKITEVNG